MSEWEGHVCTWAAILTDFRSLLRKCQLTESEYVLRLSDFTFYKWGMVVSVRRSKTIQFGERELLIPIARVPKSDLCAIHWVLKHFAQTHMPGDAPAFQVPDGTGGYRE